jgi:hypothetical protein
MSAPSVRSACRALLAIALLATVSASAAAQGRVRIRVSRDQSIIWNMSSLTPITTVPSGTELEVVGREREFFIVRVPAAGSRAATTGRIAIAQVTLIEGVAPTRDTRPFDDDRLRREPDLQVFGFGQVGLQRWSAKDTFAAVLGSAQAPMFGAGVQFRVRGQILVDGSIDYFKKNGERVFVHEGEVFKLGIRDTVRVMPVSLTVSYREHARRFAYYGGVGVGKYLYKEDSDFADPAENISERFTSYHVVGGVELGASRAIRPAIEVQYTTVPDALGTSGASKSFGETNLGGLQVRVKLLVGR